jgi:drug/metabolite transporter (DMT)-like permease
MNSKAKVLKYDAVFLTAAAIWGFAFVAQRVGMKHVGPFTFIAVRFLLGSIFLVPLLFITHRHKINPEHSVPQPAHKSFLLGSGLAGLILFISASFQQHGIVYTTAGKAGFITGLYVIIVPFLGLLWGQRTGSGTWLGAVLAVLGLYLLTITGKFVIDRGDLLVFFCAFFWAAHILIIGRLSSRLHPMRVAFFQFLVCSACAWVAAVLTEEIAMQKILSALIPILYAGFVSTGVAFTLQVIAQRYAHPTHAAIMLSLEAVFAVIGGYLILGETMSLRNLAGCALMLAGMIISQLYAGKKSA